MRALLRITPLIITILLISCKKDSGNSPVITLLGKSPTKTGVGYPYHDAGATATDQEDGDLTSSIITASTVDTGTVGNYQVIYNVTDSDGNKAEEVLRIVIVDYFKSKDKL